MSLSDYKEDIEEFLIEFSKDDLINQKNEIFNNFLQ